jgi:pimeloyl-ACP methyl ester carboxylesterase
VLRLSDGRRLGYSEWGQPDGAPIIYFHGGITSRLERQLDDARYAQLGAHLITVDRPGHGLSDFQPHRTISGWSRDVTELANALGLERFAVLGYSSGGPYALACAARISDRITKAAVVSGMGIIARAGGTDGVAPRVTRLYRNARDRPRLAAAEHRINVAGFRFIPRYAFKQMTDRRVASRPDFQQRFREAVLEGARQGVKGVVQDLAVNTAPWDFDPRSIELPVEWWHGDRDAVSPLPHAEHMAGLIPNLDLRVTANGGHFMIEDVAGDAIESLAQKP